MWSSVTRVAFIAYVSVGVVAGTVPAYDYDPRTPKNCNYWYDNDGAYPCMAMPSVAKITREQYLEWNPSLDKDTCEPFNTKQSYCTGVCEKNCPSSAITTTTRPTTTATTTLTTTSTTEPPVNTPTPTQDGMVKGCKVFTFVTKNSVCKDIANQYGIDVPLLVSWNPAFKSDCSGLKPAHYACVGITSPTKDAVLDDFEDGKMDRWTVYGGSYNAGSKALVAGSSNGGKALLGTKFEDFIFEADITIPTASSGNAGLVFRVSKPGIGADAYSGYYAGISTKDGITLGLAGGGWKQLRNVAGGVQPGRVYHMKVMAKGESLSIYVDDMRVPVIDLNNKTYGSGANGVRVYQTGATFDNIEIYQL